MALGAARSCCILTAAADLDIERLGLALLEVTRRRYGVFPEVGLAGSLMSPSKTRPLASAQSVRAALRTVSPGRVGTSGKCVVLCWDQSRHREHLLGGQGAPPAHPGGERQQDGEEAALPHPAAAAAGDRHRGSGDVLIVLLK